MVGLGTVRLQTGAIVASIGYSVLPSFWGRGYGTELASLLSEFAHRRLGAGEIHATTLDDNVASIRVLQKLGFVMASRDTESDSRGDTRAVSRWVLHTAKEDQS